jgi:Tol biopolymer transport system component
MSIAPGRSLSQYRVVDRIGEGGMGVVWRATDSTLGRDVALKVLPDSFAADPERMARFEREARLLAALNHPHIASIFGLHSDGATRFLAMELVEGEDLSQRLQHGPVPLAEALNLALQIAQALEHAHERGVIHRDLKPANVKLTSEGKAKVLDFGLAKALEGDFGSPTSSPSLTHSPTITGHMTAANVLLGTAAYMAPEQARGHAADKRADIWAFGVLLMEMLTGNRLFEGETISDTLASVLKIDPDWAALPKDTPKRVRALLRRCLERDPRQRLRDIGEARIELASILAGPLEDAPEAAAASPARGGVPPLALAAAGVVLGALATWFVARSLAPRPAEVPLRRFEIASPVPSATPRLRAISPDGRRIVFAINDTIWMQDLADVEPRRLGDVRSLQFVFWSPDSRLIGVAAGTRILKLDPATGDRQTVCTTAGEFTGGTGASWGEDGTILFSRAESDGILQVPAIGGDPKPYLPIDSTETDLHEPWILPGGRGVLFCPHTKHGLDNISIFANGKRRVLLQLPGQSLSRPAYSPSGHIVFGRTGTSGGVWAVPFSLSKLEATGEPILVAGDASGPSISQDGTLTYLRGASGGQQVELGLFDREGRRLGSLGAFGGSLDSPRFSHDDANIFVSETDGRYADVWIYDIARRTRRRLTFESGVENFAADSPDGSRVFYQARPDSSSGMDDWEIHSRAQNGTGATDVIVSGLVPSTSPDGRFVTFTTLAIPLWHVDVVSLAGDRSSRRLITGNPRALDGEVSPNGRWMAYMSDESGRWEIYLTSFPTAEGKWLVTNAGGQWPRWDATGRRLYFVQESDVMELEVTGDSAPVLGSAARLFTRSFSTAGGFALTQGFDVTRDGSKFVMTTLPQSAAAHLSITVVQNWPRAIATVK